MFILSVAVSVGIMLMNRRRAKHMIGRIEPADMQVQFRLSEKAVSMRVNSGQEARLEWGTDRPCGGTAGLCGILRQRQCLLAHTQTLHPGHGWAAAAGQPPCRSQNRRKRLKGVPQEKEEYPMEEYRPEPPVSSPEDERSGSERFHTIRFSRYTENVR